MKDGLVNAWLRRINFNFYKKRYKNTKDNSIKCPHCDSDDRITIYVYMYQKHKPLPSVDATLKQFNNW